MPTTTATDFHWDQHPDAAHLLARTVENYSHSNRFALNLAQRIGEETGTRFIDWLDHIAIPEATLPAFLAVGFTEFEDHYRHPGGQFPALRTGTPTLAIRTDSVVDCALALGCTHPIAGNFGSGVRSTLLAQGDGVDLIAIDRLGSKALVPNAQPLSDMPLCQHHLRQFRTRPRQTDLGFADTLERIRGAVEELGTAVACDLFFFAEREYWQSRNHAARVQKKRQDALGLGWANHDHHTYRSSRVHFTSLITCLETLGFVCRERFYAGSEAGWGAQVLEHPVTGIVIFADVDLSPEEVQGDFAHQQLLSARNELGTVGLWCGLHGEAFLEAGLHHLEATFDFDLVRQQLAELHQVASMAPFTDMPHLRQCFTTGERWAVTEHRLQILLSGGYITHAQATVFRNEGAIGSHLELLERNHGFKGFNQHGVSGIIAATDPRRMATAAATAG